MSRTKALSLRKSNLDRATQGKMATTKTVLGQSSGKVQSFLRTVMKNLFETLF
jgi:hypothetical protein